MFNNNVGSGNVVLGESYLIPGVDFTLEAQAERANFVNGYSYPSVLNQQFGTPGVGKPQDFAKYLRLLDATTRKWVIWDTRSEPYTGLLNNPPYRSDFWHYYGACNTQGS